MREGNEGISSVTFETFLFEMGLTASFAKWSGAEKKCTGLLA